MTQPAAPRVRIAPSPTGWLHVGTARTALYNWLYARKYGGAFLLRVEDTDRARSSDAATRAIFDGLKWLGLDWDEEVVFQGANIARHQADADRLLAAGAAYRCFCTPTDLEERRGAAKEGFRYDRRCDRLTPDEVAARVAAGDPHVLRFRVPEGTTAWDDMVHDRIEFANNNVEDFVILRSDRTPIYNLAVVSDDIGMAITLVMRGDDHISNTPKQIMLYEALGAPLPRFAHLPMIHGMDGKKLSKRHGATALGDYRDEGILPGAMMNFLALLGWSPGGDIEIMTREEMISHFTGEALLGKAAIFDPQKLEWMNAQYLTREPVAEIEQWVTPALIAAGLATAESLAARHDWYVSLLEDMLRVRARRVGDIVRESRPYLEERVEYDPEAVAKHWKDRDKARTLLEASRDRLTSTPEWATQPLEAALRSLAEERGVTPGQIFQPLRIALTGSAVSPGIFDVLVILGRERSMERIDAAVGTLG